MEDLVSGDLTIRATPASEGGPLVLSWTGKSNHRDPAKVLDPYFARALAVAASGTIEMHLQALEHFNSATLTALIGLIARARSAGVALVLLYDRAVKWQKLSLEALRVLSKGDGALEIRAVE